MRKNLLFFAGLVLLSLSACVEEDIFSTDSDFVEINAGILPATETQSRAVIDAEGKGYFTDNDMIQLFVTPENYSTGYPYSLTMKNNDWTPRLTWDQFNGQKAFFSAFYPSLTNSGYGNYTWSVVPDQRKNGAYEQSDLLIATTTAVRNQPVQLNFKHVMSRISVTLTSGSTFTAEQLESATLSLYAFNRVKINPGNGAVGSVSGGSSQIFFKRTQGSTYQAIICPQDVWDEWKDQAWITINIAGKQLVYKAPRALQDGTSFNYLEPGKQVSFKIKLDKGVEEDWSNKTVWMYGINNPPLSEWGYAYTYPYTILGLKWTPTYGWYDCNKIDPTAGSEPDSNMCWAAAAANVIYWWLDQNKKYVDDFGYNGPRLYKNSIEAEIFDLYKRYFENEGNNPPSAVNWFFTGRFGPDMIPGAGFFQKVFGTAPVVRVAHFGGSVNLSDELKKAFRAKEGIVGSIQIGSGLHAINFWGADFDENGEACAIYMTDNNDRFLDEQQEQCSPEFDRCLVQAGLIRKKIMRKANGTYMESSTPGSYTVLIDEITLLDLKTAEWEDYFRRNPVK